jgi:hypothetical protein
MGRDQLITVGMAELTKHSDQRVAMRKKLWSQEPHKFQVDQKLVCLNFLLTKYWS